MPLPSLNSAILFAVVAAMPDSQALVHRLLWCSLGFKQLFVPLL
jgi:hypothetical protein